MLFKLLKLFGLDVSAEIAAARSEIEQRVDEVADCAKQATQTAAAVVALSAAAGVLVAMAVAVGLFALYRAVAESYGFNAGLSVVAAVLVVATFDLAPHCANKGKGLVKAPYLHVFVGLDPPRRYTLPAPAAYAVAQTAWLGT